MALFTNLLHPIAFDREGVLAFSHALRLALAFRANLDLLHAEGPEEGESWAQFPGVRETLARWGHIPEHSPPEAVHGLGVAIRKVRTRDTDPAHAIGVAAGGRDLLVVSTHARTGVNRLLKGSVAEQAAREAGVPTLFVRQNTRGFVDPLNGAIHLERVLVPIHLDPDGIELAAEFVHALGVPEGRIRVLHVGGKTAPPTGPYPPVPGWRWEAQVAPGSVVAAILSAAETWPADLVVMATRGHDSVGDTLLGSTTERVLRQAVCPVLAVPVTP